MSKASPPTRIRVRTGVPDDREYFAEVAAELALMRAGEFSIYKPMRKSEPLFDMAVMAGSAARFLIKIETYSAFTLKVEPEAIPVLELQAEAEYLRAARQCPTPVMMFLFDGDRGHGRYLRLDTRAEPAPSAKSVVLSFPVENTITGDSIRALAEQLAKERAVPVAG